MCLNITDDLQKKRPYYDGNIRWKMVAKPDNNGVVRGPFRGCIYNRKEWNYASFSQPCEYTEDSDGFHCFVDNQAAYAYARSRINSHLYSVKKIEVRGFLCSGSFGGYKCETWAAFRFID